MMGRIEGRRLGRSWMGVEKKINAAEVERWVLANPAYGY